jgi:hypothetical protein
MIVKIYKDSLISKKIKIITIFCILFILFINGHAFGITDKAYIERANRSYINNRFTRAVRYLNKGYEKTQSKEILEFWISMNRRWLNSFGYTHDRLTIWEPCLKCISDKDESMWENLKDVYGDLDILFYPVFPLNKTILSRYNESREERLILVEHEKNNPVKVISIEEAKKVIESYDELKKSHNLIVEIIDEIYFQMMFQMMNYNIMKNWMMKLKV